MSSNLEKYKKDLEKLITLGKDMGQDLFLRNKQETTKLSKEEKANKSRFDNYFEEYYQKWFTESIYVVRQLISERLTEFELLYKGDGKRKTLTSHNYNIQDWLVGRRASADVYGKKYYDDFAIVVMNFVTQLNILESAMSRFESVLFNIKQIVQADLFDSELDEANELHKNGYLRAAGAIAGVILEKHLLEVCYNHSIKLYKKDPSISDYNDVLKNNNVYDIPTWRNIQRLADIRNLCNHKKQREPSEEEINDLINGVEKITKTLF